MCKRQVCRRDSNKISEVKDFERKLVERLRKSNIILTDFYGGLEHVLVVAGGYGCVPVV